jgi:hypothetical protein
MKNNIASLAVQLQELIENQNGKLTGGFLSVPNNLYNNGTIPSQNSKCITATTINRKECNNEQDCNPSSNDGRACTNKAICTDTNCPPSTPAPTPA